MITKETAEKLKKIGFPQNGQDLYYPNVDEIIEKIADKEAIDFFYFKPGKIYNAGIRAKNNPEAWAVLVPAKTPTEAFANLLISLEEKGINRILEGMCDKNHFPFRKEEDKQIDPKDNSLKCLIIGCEGRILPSKCSCGHDYYSVSCDKKHEVKNAK